MFDLYGDKTVKYTGYTDENGKFHLEIHKTTFKTKEEYPYTYDPHTTYKNSTVKSKSSVYSDRLYTWDSPKYDALSIKHFGNKGQYFTHRKPKDIEKFLCDYLELDVILCEIVEYCNASSGYPVWRFDFCERK